MKCEHPENHPEGEDGYEGPTIEYYTDEEGWRLVSVSNLNNPEEAFSSSNVRLCPDCASEVLE